MPIAAAGIAVVIGSTAFATPSVPTIFDPVTGFTWGMPFSVSTLTGTDYYSKLGELTPLGYTGASQNDVITMYNDLFAPFGVNAFSTFLSTFGFGTGSTSLAYTTTISPSNTFDNISVGKLLNSSCLPTTGCFSQLTNNPTLGFMYYTTATPTPEPSMVGLFGGMMLSMAWIAHRKLRTQ